MNDKEKAGLVIKCTMDSPNLERLSETAEKVGAAIAEFSDAIAALLDDFGEVRTETSRSRR